MLWNIYFIIFIIANLTNLYIYIYIYKRWIDRLPILSFLLFFLPFFFCFIRHAHLANPVSASDRTAPLTHSSPFSRKGIPTWGSGYRLALFFYIFFPRWFIEFEAKKLSVPTFAKNRGFEGSSATGL
jgi:hypothetical protein